MNVTIIGTGYVGLTTGLALAYIGHKVTGVDNNPEKLELLCNGKSPIHENGIDELFRLAKPNITFSGDTVKAVAEAEVIVIAVGTPPKANGEADTKYVEQAAYDVAQGMLPDRNYTVVVKSTVPIGSNRRVARVIERTLRERGVVTNFGCASNPEFLREGVALYDTFYPSRILVGSSDPHAIERLHQLYRPLLEQTFDPPTSFPRPDDYKLPALITTDTTSAEISKYAANTFLALKISFINEIAGLCEKVGADVVDVARAIGLDPRIGSRFLNAGIGWGGSCFPKDTSALIAVGKEHDYEMLITNAAREANNRQRLRIVDKLQSILKGVRGRTIGILGLTFKPGTDDLRESPVVEIIETLVGRGARVRVHDPVALDNAIKMFSNSEIEIVYDPHDIASGSDAIILATEWPEYRLIDLRRMAESMDTPILLDGRNYLQPSEARAAGFDYYGVGR